MLKHMHTRHGQRGSSAVEFALILPVIIVIALGIIEFGNFFTARFIIINAAREGASLASRDAKEAAELITLMQNAATPLNLQSKGRIYIRRIRAGQTASRPNPRLDTSSSAQAGALNVPSSVAGAQFGLTDAVYDRLVFDNAQMTSDISEVTVVEVFYHYFPITPLPSLIPGLLSGDAGGRIMSSRAVF